MTAALRLVCRIILQEVKARSQLKSDDTSKLDKIEASLQRPPLKLSNFTAAILGILLGLLIVTGIFLVKNVHVARSRREILQRGHTVLFIVAATVSHYNT